MLISDTPPTAAAPVTAPITAVAAPPPVAEDAETTIEGYASLFDVRDLAGDIVRRGAFAASLARAGARSVRMLFQHDGREPIGVWDDIAEDARGLFVRGRIFSEGGRARAARRLVIAGAVDGLSIGFRTVRHRQAGDTRELLDIDLWEVSVVTFPMLPDARLRLVPPPIAPTRPARLRA